MHREFALALVAFLPATLAAAQGDAPASPAATTVQSNKTVVYSAGPGVSVPTLLPINLTDLATGKCKMFDGTVVLSAVIDSGGNPHNIVLREPIGSDLDKVAVDFTTKDLFTPASHNGSPVAVAVSIKMHIESCIEEKKDADGSKTYFLHLRSVPDQEVELRLPPSKTGPGNLTSKFPNVSESSSPTPGQVAAGISAPKLIHSVDPEYTNYARVQHISGECLVALIVDEHGLPQNVHVVKSIDPGLDEQATFAVSQYRFKPAMKGGTPIPVKATVQVNFKMLN